MSSIARLERRVAGVLTNATTVTLSDSGATYAIRRTSDGMVMLAAGAATTNPATGIYEYNYSALNLDPSDNYTISWKIVDGATTEYVTQTIQAQPGSRASIRRQIGRLLHPTADEFLYGAVTAATATTFTLPMARVLPDDALVGKLAHFMNGTALGQARMITDSVQSTAVCTVAPAYSPAPSATNMVEIWPGYELPEVVNDHINLAIDRISEVVGVYYEQLATLDSDRRVVTLPSELTHITGVRFMDDYELWHDYLPSADPWQDQYAGRSLTVRGGYAYLNQAVPESLASVYIRGYRAPAHMYLDTDIADVNPAYLIYMAAYSLSAGMAYGPTVDPEQHASRATNWFNQAKDIELRSQTAWLPHTIPVSI